MAVRAIRITGHTLTKPTKRLRFELPAMLATNGQVVVTADDETWDALRATLARHVPFVLTDIMPIDEHGTPLPALAPAVHFAWP